jgi:hypothetical protein
VTVKLRWELDAEAEAERAAAVQAAENEKLRQARAQMLLKVSSPFSMRVCFPGGFSLRADRREPGHAHF